MMMQALLLPTSQKKNNLKIVGSADELTAALAAGEDVLLTAGEYTLPSGSLDGVTIAGVGEDTVIGQVSKTMTDVTFKNLSIEGGNGLRNCYSKDGTVTLEDCVIVGSVYGIHFDGGNGKVVVKNCDITGWNSFGSSLESVTFENCTFNKGNYGVLRFYQDATVTNCTFASDFQFIDAGCDNISITITDCGDVEDLIYNNSDEFTNVTWTVDGTVLTGVTSH